MCLATTSSQISRGQAAILRNFGESSGEFSNDYYFASAKLLGHFQYRVHSPVGVFN